ncbi:MULTISPECIES: hypothetical protein [Vibrio]|uniref:hypothetical protein n=1 Tax=Vibrio TaxID=662 RepID=UPI0018682B83|nr:MULTISPECIES: hypothetical protein [Vibrio]
MILSILLLLFVGYITESSIMNDETIILKLDDRVALDNDNVLVHIEHLGFIAYENIGEEYSIVEESGITFKFLDQRIFIPINVKLKSKDIGSIKNTLMSHKFERHLRWIQFNTHSRHIEVDGKRFNYGCYE